MEREKRKECCWNEERSGKRRGVERKKKERKRGKNAGGKRRGVERGEE